MLAIDAAHIPRNEDAPGQITRLHAALAAESRLRLPLVYALKKTTSIFSSGEKIIAAFDLNFCRIKRTNVANMSKVQSCLTVIVGMVRDKNRNTF